MYLLGFAASAISGTPLWVFAIFCYLIFWGIKTTKDRIVALPNLFIVPLIMIGFKYKLFLSGNIKYIFVYLSLMSIFFVIGFFHGTKTPIKIFKSTKSIELPGGYMIMVMLMLFFITKYVFGFIAAHDPESPYLIYEMIISGALSGYFLGKSFCFVYRYINNIESR